MLFNLSAGQSDILGNISLYRFVQKEGESVKIMP